MCRLWASWTNLAWDVVVALAATVFLVPSPSYAEDQTGLLLLKLTNVLPYLLRRRGESGACVVGPISFLHDVRLLDWTIFGGLA